MGAVLGRNPDTVYRASEGRKFAADTTLEVVICPTCGVTYAIPESFKRSMLKYPGDTRGGWKACCPFGHIWWYVGSETAIEKAKRLRREAEQREQATRDLLEHETNSHRATRGHLTRQRRRAAAGVCPCCKRTFRELARHMNSKHPAYVAEHGTKGKA